ncbi:hypothetical protein ASC90_24350 [Rhizobium sp. Root1220]|nr:hypothetical protein ASC90_24350 [Rhizobium sp. Root1220]
MLTALDFVLLLVYWLPNAASLQFVAAMRVRFRRLGTEFALSSLTICPSKYVRDETGAGAGDCKQSRQAPWRAS